ncbi:UDP-glucose 4-epimerase GalE [Bifidobacterium pseudolongum]|uniref:UDP-glucose 4-epimerase GalE n=1 Tax=Bifidobacterium pseudolongum TaxID=1694 RepID=UPI000501D12C|nr:UDP-glucose 4-epimerase GalE [Bifidobacterium pseudolongum]KFI79399.1 UDP-glucose 4-epimerase [Bifidobacterium pseudolongum subsp. pseudolongum]UNP91747.1 UDP-glucose 4-epimerase GalE [Bifidobacterium pseudolongum subsp. pseudolongum]WCA40531.1 UDP-glucose 4-epimerase GalE [Bifidobacterium pseudolongum subsp. pseudolongum]
MTVLVTGGCGYIGAHVVHALHESGQDVVVVDDLSYGKPDRIGNARLYGMDISAPGAGERLAEIMKAENVDSVIHFAARKQVGESVEKPLWYYQQNINGMLNVLEGMREAGAKKLVFSSSAATYGVPPVDVVPEDVQPMVPINPYGQTKLFGEWMARACEEPYGIRFCGLRYFNVAGCGPVELEDPAILNLIPMLFDRLKQGKAPAIFGDDYPTPDGTCVRDYIHVSDLADAHLAALKYLDRDERKYDVFNVGTGEGTSVRQIVDEVKKVTGLPFTETVMPRRAGDPPHLIGSPKRINEEMGWHAKYDVEDIVESAWNAWQANPDHHIDVETWKQTD